MKEVYSNYETWSKALENSIKTNRIQEATTDLEFRATKGYHVQIIQEVFAAGTRRNNNSSICY